MKLVSRIKNRILSFHRCESGVALIEFALSIFMLLILIFGSVEVSHYVLVERKLQDASNEESNMLSSMTDTDVKGITTAEMNAILDATGTLMKPYAPGGTGGFGADGYVIVTDVKDSGAGPIVQWKYCGGGTLGGTSKFGATGSNAASVLKKVMADKTFTMSNGDEIVVAEVLFKYTPVINNSMTKLFMPAKTTFYNVSLSVPRTVSLSTLVSATGAVKPQTSCK